MAIYGSVVAELLGISLDHDAMPVSSTPLIPLRQSLRLKEKIRSLVCSGFGLPDIISYIYTYLVGGLEHLLFFHILGIITPTDFHILNRGVGIPTTGYMISIPLLELQAKTGILKPTKLGR